MAEQENPREPDDYDLAPEPPKAPKPASPEPTIAFDASRSPVHDPAPDSAEGVPEYIGPAPEKAEQLRAAAAHLLGIAGFLGPLAFRLGREESSPFVNDQSKEALNFQLAMLLAWVTAGAASLTCIGSYLLPVVEVIAVISSVIAAMSAHDGTAYRYPYTLRFIK